MSNETRYKELGDFLRRKREMLTPEKAGLQGGKRRRTTGLRREEVAMLANVSVTWYTWLEQGRSTNPSVPILDQLAKVLQLSEEERKYVYSLSQGFEVHAEKQYGQEVLIKLQRVVDRMQGCPAYLLDEKWNMILCNEAYEALFGSLEKVEEQHRNIIWLMFLNDEYKRCFSLWEEAARGMLARFRNMTASYVEDEGWRNFIELMKSESKQFAQWWQENNVDIIYPIKKELIHPNGKKIKYEMNCFQVQEYLKLTLVVHVPV